ncbi:MAG: transcription elongation factor GreB [Myxococcota bacterium]
MDPAGEAPPTPAKRYITPEGYQRLEAELDRLWRLERPRVTREVADAAALGDRSENAEYIYGKRRLREIDRRIRFLSKRLDELTVVPPHGGPRDRVYFGAWVTLLDGQDTERTYRLVGPDETDVETGRVSLESPLGRALLGREAGDECIVQRPRGPAIFTVLSIRYEEP